MEINCDINTILFRNHLIDKMKNFFYEFEKNKKNKLQKRGFYIHGISGTGKTEFAKYVLNELNYDIINFNATDVRNKSIIENLIENNMSDKNVLSMFNKDKDVVKKKVIVMDEIDGMNNGDKSGISYLIKLIRPKKTKKQKKEQLCHIPIVCISNTRTDKQIKELMKVCESIELKIPTTIQIKNIIKLTMPKIKSDILNELVTYLNGDLRKLNIIYTIYINNISLIKSENLKKIFNSNSYNETAKEITKKLLNTNLKLSQHSEFMNETDRTIVALLWHENIIELLKKQDNSDAINVYLKILNNICFSDYIDRITFQKQIWQFNEMSSLIKTFKNNKIYHESFENNVVFNPQEVRFTKVLTKYSTEYNNKIFIESLCKKISMDEKDLLSYFIYLRKNFNDETIVSLLEPYEIKVLDINRMFRYLDNIY